jgi:hypothetical protein
VRLLGCYVLFELVFLSMEHLEEPRIFLLQLLVRTEGVILVGYVGEEQFNSVFVFVTQLVEEEFVVFLSKMEGKFFTSHWVCDAPKASEWTVAWRRLADLEVRREIFYLPGPCARR